MLLNFHFSALSNQMKIFTFRHSKFKSYNPLNIFPPAAFFNNKKNPQKNQFTVIPLNFYSFVIKCLGVFEIYYENLKLNFFYFATLYDASIDCRFKPDEYKNLFNKSTHFVNFLCKVSAINFSVENIFFIHFIFVV